MLKISYEEIIERIIKEKGVSREEVEDKINKRIKQLQDLISRDGAAHIVANEYSVKLFEDLELRKLKIKNLIPGMNSVNITGKVLSINGVKEFKTSKREGKLASLLIGDETGTIKVVLWDINLIKEIENNSVKENDIIKIKNAYSRDNNGFLELHMGNKSQLSINPAGEIIKEVSTQTQRRLNRKTIEELKENENVEILGSVVQMFEPNFYTVCPECGKRTLLEETDYICKEHGKVNESFAPVLNIFFDDGTSNIRIVFFRDLVEKLLGLDRKKVLDLKENLADFENIKKEILGKQIAISGRVVKNTMFDRLELIANDVKEVNAVEVAEELFKDLE